MLLEICISINVWLCGVVVTRFFLPCLEVLTWSLVLTLFSMSLILTMCIHMYNWKCWRYLRHGPRRLRSFATPARYNDKKIGIILFLWLATTTFVCLSWICWEIFYPLVLLVFIPVVIVTYTAFMCSSFPSCEEESSESSKVNASVELGSTVTSVELGSSV